MAQRLSGTSGALTGPALMVPDRRPTTACELKNQEGSRPIGACRKAIHRVRILTSTTAPVWTSGSPAWTSSMPGRAGSTRRGGYGGASGIARSFTHSTKESEVVGRAGRVQRAAERWARRSRLARDLRPIKHFVFRKSGRIIPLSGSSLVHDVCFRLILSCG